MTGPRTRVAPDARWREDAACIGTDTELWFPEARGGGWQRAQFLRDLEAEAKAICRRCPSIAPCLADALATDGGDPYGVRGGKTADERAGMR